jgi:hypothetical protein
MTMVFAAGMILVAAQIPRILEDTLGLLVLSSAEATARDLGGMITVSGVGTDSTYVRYESEASGMVYDVSLAGRYVNINDMRALDESSVSRISSSTTNGLAKIAVDAAGSFTSVRIFGVEKTRDPAACGSSTACDKFSVTAWKDE